MSNEEIKSILKQLANHEARLKLLESGVHSPVMSPATDNSSGKQKTLREIVKGKKFRNGQEQIAAIVGYHEKVLGHLLHKDKIREEWVSAKMTNKFSAEFISRAKDTFIRVLSDGTCDLTQTGEEFFDTLLANVS